MPWAELNALVLNGNESGEITDEERWEWECLHGFHLEHAQLLAVGRGRYEGQHVRGALNDLLLWAVALDQAFGVNDLNCTLEGFGRERLRLRFEWYQVDVVVESPVWLNRRSGGSLEQVSALEI